MDDINDDTDYAEIPTWGEDNAVEVVEENGKDFTERDDGQWVSDDGWMTNERPDSDIWSDEEWEEITGDNPNNYTKEDWADSEEGRKDVKAIPKNLDNFLNPKEETTKTEEERIKKLTNAYKKQEEANRAALLRNNDKLSNRILNDLNVAFGGYDKYTGLNKIGETQAQATNNYQDRQGNYGELLDRARNIGYGIMTGNGKYLDDINEDNHVDWYEAILGHGINTSTQALNAISGSLGLGGQLGNDIYDIYNISRGKTADQTDLSKSQQIAATIGKSITTAGLSYIDPVSQIINQIESKTNKYTTDENGNKIATGGVVSQFAEKNPLLSSVLGTALPYISSGIAGVGGDLVKRGIENILTSYNNSNNNFINEIYDYNDSYDNINNNTATKTERVENIDKDIEKSINNLYNNEETKQMAKTMLRNFDDKKKNYIADKGLVRNNETIALSDERLKSFVVAELYNNEAMKKLVGNQIIMEYWNGTRNNVPYARRTF